MVRLSDEARQYLAAFERATDVVARDCTLDDEADEPRVVFVVPAGRMSAAIGPGGTTVSRLEERLGRRVELVEDADDPATFVANALRPAAVYDVTVADRKRDGTAATVAYAEVDGDDFGAAIGAGGRNVEMATRLAGRHFDLDAVELVPDPDSAVQAVADETGVDPVDVLFDATDERLLVLVPAGTEAEVTAGRDALRSRLGWPVEVVAYAGDAGDLVANALAPATVHNVTVSRSGVAYAEVARDERGLAIGSGGRRIRRARLLAERYHGLEDVELV